jgi:hypothetical protein
MTTGKLKMNIMRFAVPVLLLLSHCGTLSAGTVWRVEISKSTQDSAPIEFSLTVTPDSNPPAGRVRVELVFAAEQEKLADLWKVYLWVMDEKKVALSVPLDVRRVKHFKDKKPVEMIAVDIFGDADTVERCVIALRCGKNAPKSETIYQIDVGSYFDKSENSAVKRQTTNKLDTNEEEATDVLASSDVGAIANAIRIAKAAVEQSRASANEFKLTSAQQLVVKGNYIWRVTFKPTKLLSPKDPSKGLIGLGGEVFVNVDLTTGKTEIRYGQ